MYFERIKNIREDFDLTQKEVANVLGISRALYSAMENDQVSFSLEKISILADYYNVSIDYLVGLNKSKRYTIKPNKANFNNLGKQLRHIRRKNKLTQENFAHELNSKQPAYAAYEKNKTIINLNKLYILAKKYNFSIDQILEKIEENNEYEI